MAEWKKDARNRFLNAPVPCDNGSSWLLDYAVAGGNIAMVQWLVDEGSDPNAGKEGSKRVGSSSIFFRCPNPITAQRPDGIAAEEAERRTVQAYQLLIEKGADLNRFSSFGNLTEGPRNALAVCRNEVMTPVLLALGIDRSPQFKGIRPVQATTSSLRGRAALDALVQEGWWEKANASTFVWWAKRAIENRSIFNRLPSKIPPFWDGYVTGRGNNLPEGLKGVDAPALFISTTNVHGDPGDATLFFINSGYDRQLNGKSVLRNCLGPMC